MPYKDQFSIEEAIMVSICACSDAAKVVSMLPAWHVGYNFEFFS